MYQPAHIIFSVKSPCPILALLLTQAIRLCFLLVGLGSVAPAFSANPTNSLARLVSVVSESSDPSFQRDVLRGMHSALEGVRSFPMPEGWRPVEEKLASS